MKTTKFIATLVLFLGFLFVMPTDLGATPPPWAPAHGYRAKTRHIYFPQQNMYYDLQKNVYIFLNHGNWMVSASIPAVYGRIDLRMAKQIQIAVNSSYPYRYHKGYSAKEYYEYPTSHYVKNPKKAYIKHSKFNNNGKHKH